MLTNKNHHDNDTREQDLAILATGLHSFQAQAHNGRLESVAIPDSINTADEFVAWIRSADK